jgi:predicted dinucleotide-binding enzyme
LANWKIEIQAADRMKIGIMGAGPVGSSLGKALLNAEHEIMFSSRDPQGNHAQTLRSEMGAVVGSVAGTAESRVRRASGDDVNRWR